LIERLQTRLGRQQIQRLCVMQDHRPEAAYRFEEIDQAVTGDNPVTSDDPIALSSHSSLPRPLWLLRTPVPIGERNNRPYWGSTLNLLAGPERIESGWWDGALVQRDYFIAEDDANVLYWIYRDRLGSADPGKGWFMQGRFG
jgi:protein ImuB